MIYRFLGIAILLLYFAPSVPAQRPVESRGEAVSVEQEIIKLESEKDAAFERGDRGVLGRIYADDYVAVAANGAETTKKEVLGIFVRPQVWEQYRSEDLKVRVFGEVAVVTGLLKRKWYRDIKPQDNDPLRYTNVYARRQGEWKIVASQFTRVKK